MSFESLRAIMIAVLLASGLAACNTIEGAGEDLDAAGEAIENSADKATSG